MISMHGSDDTYTEYPLNPIQMSMWVDTKLQRHSLFYIIARQYVISGPLNHHILEKSLQAVVDTHASLRATVVEVDQEPRLRVATECSLHMPFTDLSKLSPSEHHAFIKQYTQQALTEPFDLESGPLIRANLLRTDLEEHRFILVLHHIIADHLSLDILHRDLSEFYNAFMSRSPNSMSDITSEQHQELYHQSVDWTQAHLEYWKKELQNLPKLKLPSDTAVGADSGESRTAAVVLPSSTVERLRLLCGELGVTPFMFLLSGFATLLHYLTNQEDIVLGTYVTNRSKDSTAKMIGVFFNIVSLRIKFQGSMQFRDVVFEARNKVLTALAHSNYSFDDLVSSLPDAHINRNYSIFNVTFQMYYERQHELDFEGLTVTSHRIVPKPRYPLMGYAQIRSNQLHLWLNFDHSIYQLSTVQRFLQQYVTLLSNVLAQPDIPLSELEWLPAEERARVLFEFNQSQMSCPDVSLHEAILRQTIKSPDRVAVVEHKTSEQLTYSELNASAEYLAHHLTEYGLRAGEFVGVLLDRSIELLVAHLAILKAGAISLPLNTDYPRERIRYMLRDTDARFVLTSNRVSVRNHVHQHIDLVDVSHFKANHHKETSYQMPPRKFEDIAFIIYTSGSRARPKGVLLKHIGLVNQIYHRLRLLGISENSTTCLSLSTGFVTLPLQLFAPLFVGARLIIYDDVTVQNPYSLFQQVERDTIDTIEVTVSSLSLYLELVDQQPERRLRLPNLRSVMIAGEKLRPDIVRHFFQTYDGIQLINAYGQTECSGMTLSTKVPFNPETQMVDEGLPSQNNKVFILNRYRQPSPIGIAGEVHISGYGVSAGYNKKPELTRAAFLGHFLENEGILYRTGDIGRWLPDGRVQIIGRVDDQVKIRGSLVEPSEIEYYLRKHSAIRNCAVVSAMNHNQDLVLVAYYTSSQKVEPARLRLHLERFLPHYMIPSYFVKLGDLPLNPNGKIDKQLLSTYREFSVDREYIEPISALEHSLAQIWGAILNISRVGRFDNFFDLGGYSLQAVQITARIDEKLGVSLSPSAIFEYPTLASLAEHILDLPNDRVSSHQPEW